MQHKKHTLLGFVGGSLLTLLFIVNLSGATATPAIAATLQATATPAGSCDGSRSIQVSGSAVINVPPDRATLQLGVTSNDVTPEGVHSKNTAAIKNVIKAIRQLGVAERDISTDRYIIHPLYTNYDSLEIKGYRINNIVAVTLKDVGKVSDVLSAALTSGANEVIDVKFYTSELRRYRDDARALAMKAAREKAQALAEAAGAQAGCVLEINENSWSAYSGSWWGGRDRPIAQNVMQNASGASQPQLDDGPISLGQIAVQAEVQARFSIK
ncbi:MAG TPA: SIMPL domain-containing protein [Anaerolineae bacterium]